MNRCINVTKILSVKKNLLCHKKNSKIFIKIFLQPKKLFGRYFLIPISDECLQQKQNLYYFREIKFSIQDNHKDQITYGFFYENYYKFLKAKLHSRNKKEISLCVRILFVFCCIIVKSNL